MDIQFPSREYAGYIFDLDGTLIDSMPAHFRAWTEGLRQAGFVHEFGEDFFYSLGGVPTARIVEMLNERHGTEMDPLAVTHAKEEIYLTVLAEITVIEPVAAFARERKARGIPLAVASGGMRHVVRRSLEATGLLDLFPIIVTPEDVAHGKPAPDLFLLAAERMKAPPRECLVFEDAEMGRRAAVAAGMDYVLVPSRVIPAPSAGTTGGS
ncbi:MAG: HAD family hydrolase [Opitutaceae bacterium]